MTPILATHAGMQWRKCGRCHRSAVPAPYDSCPSCVVNLAKSLAEEMRKVRALEATVTALRKAASK